MPPAPVLELPRNSIGAGINLSKVGTTGTVGYRRGPIEVAANGGVTWRKSWFAGARATYHF